MSILVNWLESLHEEMNVTTKCLRVRNLKSTCNLCVQSCEHNAIEINGVILIDTQKCTLCGECMIACPLSAIEGIASNRFFEKGSLVFDESYTPSLKELLIYKKRGMTSIQLNNQVNHEWETVVANANEQLQSLDESPIIFVNKVTETALSRRAFFSSFQKEGKQLAKSMAPAAWKIEQDDWKLTKYYPDFQFYCVTIDQVKCSLCQACFSLCPENVFHIEDNKLVIEHEKCVNCTSCTDVCSENAIEIISDVKRKIDQIVHVHSKTCQDCGHSFYTFVKETEKCHVCADRDSEWLSPY
jgi:Fe-S-cluster-containing hydrogenase component 2